MRALAMLPLCAALVAGCGQKGDLYLPESTREVVASPPAAAPAPAAPAAAEGDTDDETRRQQAAPAAN